MNSRCLLLITICLLFTQIAAGQSTVTIDNQTFAVEIVDTLEARVKGLSGRENLAPNTGMLFIFERPGLHRIWMKDMLFPIDIVWINSFGAIVHIQRQAHPDSYPHSFVPPKPALYILEISAEASAGFEIDMPVYFENVVVKSGAY